MSNPHDELPWPDHDANVFEAGGLWGLPTDVLECWDFYARSYRRAGETLIANRAHAVSSYALLPAAFLARHSIELRLKHMLLAVSEAFGPPLPTDWRLSHNLLECWSQVRPRLVGAWPGISVAELDNVERLLAELHHKDGGSFVFRYPTDRGGGVHLADPTLGLNSLSLPHYFEVLGRLSDVLDLLSDCLQEVVRQAAGVQP